MEIEREVPTSVDAGATQVALVNRAEVDQQIRTARQFPRDVKRFRSEVLGLATVSVEAAEDCSYALQRDGKVIVGPSARFAELVAHAWGNSRAGARVIDDRGDYVTAQGAFIDLEKNVAITFEVRRRIVTKNGARFSADMIGVTANAASAIALRNATLRAIPKPLWWDLWDEVQRFAVGDESKVPERRKRALAFFAAHGIDEAKVLAKLGKATIAEIRTPELAILTGLRTAIKEGEQTAEAAFAPDEPEKPAPASGTLGKLNEELAKPPGDTTAAAPATPGTTTESSAKPAPVATSATEQATAKAAARQAAKAPPAPSYAAVADKIRAARNADELGLAADLIRTVEPAEQRPELAKLAADRVADFQ